MLLLREHGWTADSAEVRAEATFKPLWREKTKMVLVENEARRRRQMRAQLQEEGREQAKADEELEARKRKREHEQSWEQTRDGRISSWRDFQKGGEKKKKKTKVKPLG